MRRSIAAASSTASPRRAAALLLALPVFVLGTLLVLLLAQTLRLMPAGGYAPITQSRGAAFHACLRCPRSRSRKGLAAVVFRMTRASVLDALSRDYVRTARAKGLSPRRVVVRHVVRNALTPVLTVLGLHMGTLLGGTVLVEYVFNWPGLSTPLLRAVEARDYPMVVGIVLTISGLFLLINLIMDLLYAALDPRVRRDMKRLWAAGGFRRSHRRLSRCCAAARPCPIRSGRMSRGGWRVRCRARRSDATNSAATCCRA